MKTLHTPGPWLAAGIIQTVDNKPIAQMMTEGDAIFADTRLIAAAPEMLEALEAYKKAVAAGVNADPILWSKAFALTEHALKKAKGE